jgi:hypothetical protein
MKKLFALVAGLLMSITILDVALADGVAPLTPGFSDNGKVQFVSGGVAESGMDAIKAVEHDYNLKMLFVAVSGDYLANISVNIADSKGNTVLDTTATGPVLLVKMPAGRYAVSTKASGGSVLTQAVDVNNDHLASYVLRYPAKEQ